MPEPVDIQTREPFESVTIYTWVAQLRVRSYEDLLEPHWSIPDRSMPCERFDRDRFVRLTAADDLPVAVALPRVRQVGIDALDEEGRSVAVLIRSGRLADASAAAAVDVVKGVTRRRVRDVLYEWMARLRALFVRRRR
jgi:hypothetical protein